MIEGAKRKGSITELKVMSKLLEFGEVSIPYGNNARYDCILDINGKLIKIQIKTAMKKDENRFSIPFANKGTGNSKNVRKIYLPTDVDYISTVYKDVLYLFPTGTHTNAMTLSFEYPSNGLKAKINLAENYLAENILKPFLCLDTL